MYFTGIKIFTYKTNSKKLGNELNFHSTPLIFSNKEPIEIYSTPERKLEIKIFDQMMQISLYIYHNKYTEFIVLEKVLIKDVSIKIFERKMQVFFKSTEYFLIGYYENKDLQIIKDNIECYAVNKKTDTFILAFQKMLSDIKLPKFKYCKDSKTYIEFVKNFRSLTN